MRPEVLAEHLASTIRGLVEPLRARVDAVEGLLTKDVSRVEGYTSFLQRDLATALDRIGALESREPIPGPPGPPGEPGPPGRDGVDGKDGAPGLKYCGVFVRGKTYDQGDLVTAGGSAWYCRTTTNLAPGNSGDWSLMVKRGRDARERQATP